MAHITIKSRADSKIDSKVRNISPLSCLFPQGKLECSYQDGRAATKSGKANTAGSPDSSGSQLGLFGASADTC